MSGDYAWRGEKAPNFLVFDMNGRRVDCPHNITKTATGWNVRLKLHDWAQIAVIEQ